MYSQLQANFYLDPETLQFFGKYLCFQDLLLPSLATSLLFPYHQKQSYCHP